MRHDFFVNTLLSIDEEWATIGPPAVDQKST